MRKYLNIVLSLIAGIAYLGITIGSFIAGYEGISTPSLKYMSGVISERNCTHVKSTVEDFSIEGSNKEYNPNMSGSCSEYFSLFTVGSKVKFHATERGDLWSLEINDNPIRGLEEYTKERKLFAPFSLALEVIFVVIGPLFYWAYKRDLRRRNVPNQM